MSFWLKDPTTKQPSPSLTFLVLGFLVASVKLFISGLTIEGYTMSEFTGSDFAMVLGAAAGLYGYKKHQERSSLTKNPEPPKKSEDGSKPPVEGAN